MRLNRLYLHGFKSFATPTELLFSEGFTGVVGPNGCGKSNIVDSIKWVLGDRSAKSLRGEEMMDVIFNGGNGTPTANFAEVSLSFANNDKTLPLDYDEITITRRLYRTGESEYFINNQNCRLKDIRELFMDTGVGMESYSIIEQGEVDFVLKASPSERRGLFEEAAGISKYKSRRKETESKLERVQQDLLRLNDTSREIKSQVRSIKIQATKAQKYKQLAEEIRGKKISLFLHQYHQFLTQRNEIAQRLAELTQQNNSLKEQVNTIQNAIINLEKEMLTVDNDARKEQNDLMTVSSEISAVSTEIENNKKRYQELLEEESRAKKQLGILTQQAISTRQTICETMHLLEVTKKECETLSTQIIEQDNTVQELVKEEKSLTEGLDTKRNEVFEVTHKKSQYQNELTEIQNELKNLSQRRDKCQQRQGEIGSELSKLGETINLISHETSDSQNKRESLKSELVQMEQVEESLKEDLCNVENNINQYQTEAHKKLARKEILEDLESHNEGLSSGVKAVLDALKSPQVCPVPQGMVATKDSLSEGMDQQAVSPPDSTGLMDSFSNGLSIHGILADLIKVDPKYVSAIESALGDLAQAIVTRSTNDSLRVIDFIKTARKEKVITIAADAIVNNFTLYPALPSLPGVLGKASQVVKTEKAFEPIVEWLLGPYLLVENLEIARGVLGHNQPFRPIVTLSGEAITAEGIISGGVSEAGISILSRKTELSTLREELQAISENLKVFTEQKTAKEGEILQVEDKAQKCRQDIYEQEIALLDKKKSLEEIQRRTELLNKEQEISQLELTETINQVNSLAERATSTAEVIKEMEKHLAVVQGEIEELTRNINEYNERKKEAVQKQTDLKINFTSSNEKKEYLNTSINQLNNQILQIEGSLKTTSDSIIEAQAKLKSLESVQVEFENKLKLLSDQKSQIQNRLNALNQQMEQLKTTLNEKKAEENKLTQEIQVKENNATQLGLQEREASLKTENLAERAKEETGNVLTELYANYTDDPSTNWEEINQQILDSREKLGTMTDVNLSAIDQLKELEERLALYETQEQDLTKSKHSLQELIRKLNRESREKFQSVFNQIQENFNTVFRKLFGGGKAELVLCKVKSSEPAQLNAENATPETATPEGSEAIAQTQEILPTDNNMDVLEAGIDIMAKPPGKEPTSIGLLSGGEKTMTAFALMMAIFQLRPSPFCILDEADATLDESNVNRFIALLREYTAHTQFIVISHNKKTMVTMDRLHGLTMEKSGVSKKISVKMSDERQPVLATTTTN